jgi:hypothetical protein
MMDIQSWWRLPLKRTVGTVGFILVCGSVFFATNISAQYNNRDPRCQELERELVSDWQLNNNPRDTAAALDQKLAEFERARSRATAEAERQECYEESFLFGRSLRQTGPCTQLDKEIENARRNISNLREQRDALMNSNNRRMRHDELVAELARNGCGDSYSREHENSRRSSQSFFSLWEDDESKFDNSYANQQPNQSNLPYTSYRTMCVRLCDGYYFPVSFSTLESRFQDDETKCREQCAAPAELYVYKNPGEEVDQMVSIDGRRYADLKTAWRNRKVFIKGCSCKAEEYSVEEIAASERALGKQATNNEKPAGSLGAERNVKSSGNPSGTGAKGTGKPQ